MALNKNISYVYSELERDLEAQIRGGLLKPGECILSENELSQKYGVSRRSSRKAVSNLVEKKLLYRLAGKGTFVSDSCMVQSSSLSHVAISFIVPDIDDIFISEVCRGVQAAANEFCCNLIIQSSNGCIEKENENIEFSLERRIDGAIIFPNWGRANIDAVYKLKERGVPFVLIDRYFRDIDTDYVVVDNRNGAFKATERLIGLGHRKIAHLYGTEGSANDDRLDGYRDALAVAGIVYNPEYVKRTDTDAVLLGSDRFEPDKQSGYDNMKKLLALKDPPTAVFAGNDYQAIGAIQAIKDAGLKAPDDLAVVGFDDLKFSGLLEPPLTTVRQPKSEIGSKAFEVLLEKINSSVPVPRRHIVLETELVIRRSCGGK
jgi:DNA-binding LacI/PurR family transcriptional regulator